MAATKHDRIRRTAAVIAARLADDAKYQALRAILAERESERGIAAKFERLRGKFKSHLLDRQAEIAAQIAIRLTVQRVRPARRPPHRRAGLPSDKPNLCGLTPVRSRKGIR